MTDPATISAADPLPRRRVRVLDSEMAFVDAGAGAPIVFLHGNPTSSYLWRNVIPHLLPLGRCLAPDLIGMGESGPSPAGSYTFADHSRYLDAWFDSVVGGARVVLILHDWGSALGFHWARRNPARVAGLAYMEAIVQPVSWADWPEKARRVFQGMRSPEGDAMVLEKNVFVERILPGSVLRGLTEAEMQVYRKPFLAAGEARRPVLTWPREIPIDGQPAEVKALVEEYGAWLSRSSVPKLFIDADPGSILVGRQRDFCRGFPAQTEVQVRGSHFIQEDSPDEIGAALAAFVRGLPGRGAGRR
ncbi:MAG: haloalkane dehalogenase [Myxococcales bacterium]